MWILIFIIVVWMQPNKEHSLVTPLTEYDIMGGKD